MKDKEIRRVAAKVAKETKYYKVLTKRKYRNVSDYIKYEDIAIRLASQLMTTEISPSQAKPEMLNDITWNALVHDAAIAYQNPLFPVFALTPDLAKALNQTELPNEYCPLNKVFNFALILIPDSLQMRSPDGHVLKWVMVNHFKKGDKPKPFSFNHHYVTYPIITTDRLIWSTILEDTFTSYTSCCDILEDGGIGKSNFQLHDRFKDGDVTVEQKFTNSVSQLILNTILYLQLSRTETSSADSVTSKILTKGSGFAKNNVLEPIWIGKDYKRKVRSSNDDGTHASPTMHTRRGHMRYYRQEKGWKQDKLVWIEPTLVNG
jgi:hypothetical protein